MRTTFIPLLLACSLLLTTSTPIVSAQDAARPQTTATISAVPAGKDLIVETADGRTIKGKFRDVDASTLTLSRKNRRIELSMIEVQRVYRLVGRSRAKTTLIGTGIGAGIGGGLTGIAGIAAGGAGDDAAEGAVFILGTALLGASIGAVAGALAGRGRKRVLIYEAPQP